MDEYDPLDTDLYVFFLLYCSACDATFEPRHTFGCDEEEVARWSLRHAQGARAQGWTTTPEKKALCPTCSA